MISGVGKLVIGGDICPVDSNAELFDKGDAETLFGSELCDVFHQSTGVIFNLETPLCSTGVPIKKTGASLRTSPEAVNSFNRMNCAGVALANNHVLDQGATGLMDTLECLSSNGLRVFGGGENMASAERPLVLEAGGFRIGLLAFAEHEFSIAGAEVPGSNPFNQFRSIEMIRSLSKNVDRVIVLYHGMKEYYQYPSPEVRDRCRAMVEAGASLVLSQHSHCIGCMETYRDSTILYGQGDFHFAKGDRFPLRSTGLVVLIEPSTWDIEFVPLTNDGKLVRIADGPMAKQTMDGFWERSEQIKSESFVESNWKSFCLQLADSYISQIQQAYSSPAEIFIVKALRKIGILKHTFRSGRDVAPLLNILQCESHNEVLRTALGDILHGE